MLNKKGIPVWINCRGKVIDDGDGRPCYLLGCLNETGKRQRADNISGLLGEREMGDYLYSHVQKCSPGFFMQVGIDDFGSGYSNLHCINDMNPDYVKIDKDFTAKAMGNEKDYEQFVNKDGK